LLAGFRERVDAVDQDRRRADEPALLGCALGIDHADADGSARQPSIAQT
jgi:hypothetical protein